MITAFVKWKCTNVVAVEIVFGLMKITDESL
jgi:hypothetical protein